MTSSAGYECCFNDFEAGCATLLASTIRLLQPLILCSFFTISSYSMKQSENSSTNPVINFCVTAGILTEAWNFVTFTSEGSPSDPGALLIADGELNVRRGSALSITILFEWHIHSLFYPHCKTLFSVDSGGMF
ncbi:hypothetical protein T12_11162 [Trichinella patagoniensis]|uniref:Uncharacterized protein n=1 Tax=Trichinella patagoniensis TaxID=990121 RepID=A0A0V0Z3N7_9BILA|nr:hypothetical protein T12_11162 [Trichinella patagoniensis]